MASVTPGTPEDAATGGSGGTQGPHHEPRVLARRRGRWPATLVKLLLAAAIVMFLARQVDADSLREWLRGPKRWDLLGLAFVWVLAAHLITYIRWWQLLRSLSIAMPLTEAIRVGFLGTAFNLVSVGGIGGDVFKAIAAARHTGRRKLPEVIASILLDRTFGLVGLILVAAVGLEAYVRTADAGAAIPPELQQVRWISNAVAAASVLGLAVLVAVAKWLPVDWLSRLPLVGPFARQMAASLRLLHGRLGLLALQIAESCGVHLTLTIGFYLTSRGVYPPSPGLLPHLVAIPPAFAVAALPIFPGGVGVFESAVVQLMKVVAEVGEDYLTVLVVVLVIYRLMLSGVAAIGGLYYLAGAGRLREEERRLAAELHGPGEAGGSAQP